MRGDRSKTGAHHTTVQKLRLIRRAWEQLKHESRVLALQGDLEGSWRKAKAAQMAEAEWRKLDRKYRQHWRRCRSRDPPARHRQSPLSFIHHLTTHYMNSLATVFKNPPATKTPAPVQQKQTQATPDRQFYAFKSRTDRIFCFQYRAKAENGYQSTAEYLKSRGSYVAKFTKPYPAKSLAEAKRLAPKMLEA